MNPSGSDSDLDPFQDDGRHSAPSNLIPCTICELHTDQERDTTIDETYYSDDIDPLCTDCALDIVGKIY